MQRLKRFSESDVLQPGVYVVHSDDQAFGPMRAFVATGQVTQLGERYLPDGEKEAVFAYGQLTPNQEGEEGALIMGPEFFASAIDDYANWREGWWREAIQNAVDAGATEIRCSVKPREDGGVVVECEDNGQGMDRETLRNVFMKLKGTAKRERYGSTGGFGEAKRLLVLPWISYEMHTRDTVMRGSGATYKTFDDKARSGTRLTVVMPQDLCTSSEAAIAYIAKCYLPNVRIFVDGERVKANLTTGEAIRNLGEIAELFYDKKKATFDGMIVRIHDRAHGTSLAMFPRYVPSEIKGQLVVEIYARSTEVLTSNRDGFRGGYNTPGAALQSAIDQYVAELSADVSSSLKKRKGLVQQKFLGTGKFDTSHQIRAAMLDGMGSLEPAGKEGERGKRELSTSQAAQVLEALQAFATQLGFEQAQPETEVVRMCDPELAASMLDGLQVGGAEHMEAIAKQLSWQPDFFLVNEIEGFRVPKKFYPESMTSAVRKLARCWAEMCRFVLVQLGSKAEFGVGFLIDRERLAEYRQDDGDWLMLNPFKSGDPTSEENIYQLQSWDDMMELYAMAVHECTHMADGVSYHNESFASAFTKNVARTSGKEKQLRALKRIVLAEEKKTKERLAAERGPRAPRVAKPKRPREVGFMPPEPGSDAAPFVAMTGGAPFEVVTAVEYYGNLKGVVLWDADAGTHRYEIVSYDSSKLYRLDPAAVGDTSHHGELGPALTDLMRKAYSSPDVDVYLFERCLEVASIGSEYIFKVTEARWTADTGTMQRNARRDLGPPYTIEELNSLLGTRSHRKATHYPTLEAALERATQLARGVRAFMTINVLDRSENVVASVAGDTGELRSNMRGGLAEGMHASDFNAEQLARGVEDEMEHTDDPEIAQQIAMDHIVKDRNAYMEDLMPNARRATRFFMDKGRSQRGEIGWVLAEWEDNEPVFRFWSPSSVEVRQHAHKLGATEDNLLIEGRPARAYRMPSPDDAAYRNNARPHPGYPTNRAPYVVTVKHAGGAEDPSFPAGDLGDTPLQVAERAAQVLHGPAYIRVYDRAAEQTTLYEAERDTVRFVSTGKRLKFPPPAMTPNGGYYVWVVDSHGNPLASEETYGPYDLLTGKSYARIAATEGAHDRVVSYGRDPTTTSFEVVRRYQAGTGERLI